MKTKVEIWGPKGEVVVLAETKNGVDCTLSEGVSERVISTCGRGMRARVLTTDRPVRVVEDTRHNGKRFWDVLYLEEEGY